MKIKKVIVQKLFGLYDYELNFFVDETITILHGPNGSGKTSVLKLTQAAIDGDVFVLDTIPFNCLEVVLDNQDIIKVVKDENYQSIFEQDADSYFTKNCRGKDGGLELPLSYTIIKNGKIVNSLNKIILKDDFTLYLRRYSFRQRTTRKSNTERLNVGQVIGVQNVLSTYDVCESLYDIILEYSSDLQVKFIKANRVNRVMLQAGIGEDENELTEVDTIDDISKGLKKLIQDAIIQKEKISDKLDRTFPKRVIGQYTGEKKEFDKAEILKRLDCIRTKRLKYSSLGIGTVNDEEDTPIELVDDALPIIDLYVKDCERKYDVFDKLLDKLYLYLEIFNGPMMFQNKIMMIHTLKGITILTDDLQREISLNKLSSGEKNALILFYDLIFTCNNDTVLLIDEPEISLHISWQVEYINVLLKICKLKNIQAIIATHSPNIVDEHYDLLVDMVKE